MSSAIETVARPARRSWWCWVGGTILLLSIVAGAAILVWDWNWFRPFLETRLSASLGRKVSMERLEIAPGRIIVLTAHGVKVGNPEGIQAPDFATIPHARLAVDAIAWWKTSRIVVPEMALDQPVFSVEETVSGETNLAMPAGPSTVEIGRLDIRDGVAHVHSERLKTEVTTAISTTHDANGDTLIIEGKGTHARQPITFHAVGGAILALRDAKTPYPVDLQIANGPTRITLKGQISDPLMLRGADLNLVLTGPNMELLLPLTGIATPKTPPYRISGKFDFADGRVKFTNIVGRVGSSDLNGDLDIDPRGARPVVTGALVSRQLDMEDLGGFIGAEPGRPTTPGQTPKQIQDVKRAEASPKLLPDKPISIPKVLAADVHLTYRGDKILGRKVPFNSIEAKLDIDDGHIRLSPLRLGIGAGGLNGTVDLTPIGDQVQADVDVTLDRVNIAPLLASAGLRDGKGIITGAAKVKGRGDSLAAILAHGDGALRASMPAGGNIDALLVDLMGIELGSAFFAAIGLPDKESIQCMAADFVLRDGILASRQLEVDTTDHVIAGGARIDLSREVLEAGLRTDPKHFTIAKLATPIMISGSFKNLHFAPTPELALRGGAAIGLGLLFPPAAILPTIQFGVGDKSPCAPNRR